MKVGIPIEGLGTELEAPQAFILNLVKHLLEYNEIELYIIHHQQSAHPLFKDTQEIILPNKPFLGWLELEKHRLDIIHFNDIPRSLGKLPVIFPRVLECKKVATIHGDIWWSEPHLNDYMSKNVARYRRFVDPLISKFLDKLIPVSHNLKSGLIRYLKIPEAKFRPIHLGIDHEVFKPVSNSKSKIMEKYGIEKDFILHVSNYSKKKNPFALFNTFEQLLQKGIDLNLVILGKRWKDKIHEFLKDKHSEMYKRIKIIGYVPLEDLPLFYNAAEVFFSPTYHETFGFPIVEAMACGTPVVTSNAYSIPEVADDAAFLCNPYNFSEFVEAIKRVLEDKNLKEEMKKRGLKNAKRFSWRKCAEEHLEVYEAVLK